MHKVVQYLRRAALLQDGAGLKDGQLLTCFIEDGDDAALSALVRRHGAMVWGVCRRILGDQHDTDDAFQATFLVLLRKAASVVPREMVGNRLYGVANQTALKARATIRKRRQRERQVTAMPETSMPEQPRWDDLQHLLDQELRRLPDKYRVAIVLCDLEGRTRKEAARQLEVPEGTLAARLSRGREMLAKRLRKHGGTLSAGTLATLLAQNAASASVPPTLVSATVKAMSLVTGKTATAGALSAQVVALTEGVVKSMLFTKIKIAMAVLLGVSLVGGTVIGLSTGPGSFQTQAVGQTPQLKKEGKEQNQEPAEKQPLLVKVACPLDGIVLCIGTEIKDKEKVPPDKVIAITVDGKERIYRRLVKGDSVREGQLLSCLDDRLARMALAVMESKLKRNVAESFGAAAIAAEAALKLKTAETMLGHKSIAMEEYRSAKLTSEKMYIDTIIKKEAVKQAELELRQVQTMVAVHEIRSRVNGVIAAIHKQPGEGAKKFETVLEIEVAAEPPVASSLRLVSTDPTNQEAFLRSLLIETPDVRVRSNDPVFGRFQFTAISGAEMTEQVFQAMVLRVDQRDIYIQVMDDVYAVHIGRTVADGVKKSLTVAEVNKLDLLKLVKPYELKKKNAAKSGPPLRVPAKMDGIIAFIGTDIKEGEKVPPGMLVPTTGVPSPSFPTTILPNTTVPSNSVPSTTVPSSSVTSTSRPGYSSSTIIPYVPEPFSLDYSTLGSLLSSSNSKEKEIKFRRLVIGDRVQEGQLLARLDDRLAQLDLAGKEIKVKASKAEVDGAEAIAKEAEIKLKTAEGQLKSNSIAPEEYRAAKLTSEKMQQDLFAKVEGLAQAELELRRTKLLLSQYEIRAPKSGIIVNIHRHPGEAVRALETVFEIEVAEK